MPAACCVFSANYVVKPHPTRPGWERVTCKVCGKWIGDRDRNAKGAYNPLK